MNDACGGRDPGTPQVPGGARSPEAEAARRRVEALLAGPVTPAGLQELESACRAAGSLALALGVYRRLSAAFENAGRAVRFSRIIDGLLAADPAAIGIEAHRERRARNLAWFAAHHPHLPLPGTPDPADAGTGGALPDGAFWHDGWLWVRDQWRYHVGRPADLPDGSNYLKTTHETVILEGRSVRVVAVLAEYARRRSRRLLRDFVLVVAPPAVIERALWIEDFTGLDGSGYLVRFIDYDRLQGSFLAFFGAIESGLKDPRILTGSEPVYATSFVQAVNDAFSLYVETFTDKLAVAVAKCGEFYPPGFAATVPAALAAGGARVLVMTTHATTFLQYCSRDVVEAFRQLGHQPRLYIEGEHETTGHRFDAVAEAILAFRPHLAFIIDHLRPEFGGAINANLPMVSWIQDPLSHLMSGEYLTRLTPNDVMLTVFKDRKLDSLGYRDLQVFPIPVDTAVFDGDPATPDYDHDLGYVGHRPYTRLDGLYRGADLSGRILEVLEGPFARDPHACVEPEEFHRLLQPACDLPGLEDPPTRALIENVWINLGSYLCRQTVLDWAAACGVDFALFGNDWDKFPRLARHARGPLAHGPDLARAFNRCRINLHVNPSMTMHQRVLQVLASGGFLMVRRIAGGRDKMPVDRFIPEGDGYVFFDDQADLRKKVRHYLDREAERREIAGRGRDRVRAGWSYKARIAVLIEQLQRKFSPAQGSVGA